MGSYCLSCSRRFLFIFGQVAFIFLIGTLRMAKPMVGRHRNREVWRGRVYQSICKTENV